MKRIRFSGFTCVLPWAIVGGILGSSSVAFSAAKSSPKGGKASASAVRAQDSEDAGPARVKLTDEEIFDSDLKPASALSAADVSKACVGPTAPNCTDILGHPAFPTLPNTDSTSGPTPPEPPSMPQQAQTPPAYSQPSSASSQAPDFQGLAGNQSVAPFMGDFFGGSLVSTTSGSPTTALYAADRLSPNLPSPVTFYQLAPLGNSGNVYQTNGSAGAVSQTVNGTTTIPGAGTAIYSLVPVGSHAVLFNPPSSNGIPNPQIVTVYAANTSLNTGGIDPAVATGRTKLAEGSSPIPRNRVFFNYSYFDNTQLTSSGVPVNRYTPGFEKTFFNGNGSIEVRMPFASTLTSNLDTSGIANPTDMQFGNMTIYSKALLFQNRTYAVSTGLGFSLPTANNVNVYNGTQQLLHVRNDSVHLLPFVGGVYTPNDRFYTQGLLQFDIDPNGNRVYSFTDSVGNATTSGQEVGVFRDASYVYASVSTGYWIYRTTTPGALGLTGLSPIGELHYNRSLQSGNVVSQQVGSFLNQIYGQSFSNIEVLNAVVGTNMLFGNNRILSVGYTTPLGMGVDKQFSGELRVMFNWYFGGGNSSPLTRVGRVQF